MFFLYFSLFSCFDCAHPKISFFQDLIKLRSSLTFLQAFYRLEYESLLITICKYNLIVFDMLNKSPYLVCCYDVRLPRNDFLLCLDPAYTSKTISLLLRLVKAKKKTTSSCRTTKNFIYYLYMMIIIKNKFFYIKNLNFAQSTFETISNHCLSASLKTFGNELMSFKTI